jgi:hypothetical protein
VAKLSRLCMRCLIDGINLRQRRLDRPHRRWADPDTARSQQRWLLAEDLVDVDPLTEVDWLRRPERAAQQLPDLALPPGEGADGSHGSQGRASRS